VCGVVAFSMTGFTRVRLLSAFHFAAARRVEQTETGLRTVAAEAFRERRNPRPEEVLALIELDQKLNREKGRLARIDEAMSAG
jgi:hypothetical protein